MNVKVNNGTAIRGNAASGGTMYLDVSADAITGTLNIRGTTVNMPNLNANAVFGQQFNANIGSGGYNLSGLSLMNLKTFQR